MTAFNAEKFPKPFSELSPELQDKFTQWHGPDWAPMIFEMARTAGGAYGTGFFDLRPQLRQVTCPALVIYPDRSALFGVEQGVGMYQALPKGELAVMAMCGHNTYEYRPWEYARHVLEFHERLAQAAELSETSPAGAKLDPNQTCAS
jgi:pimeloyl-ACP methyl ester carboxylesterase